MEAVARRRGWVLAAAVVAVTSSFVSPVPVEAGGKKKDLQIEKGRIKRQL